MTAQRFPVRDKNYYGGDLYVEWDGEPEDELFVASPFQVVWNAWGGYGRVALTLTTEEAHELRDALTAALDTSSLTRFS